MPDILIVDDLVDAAESMSVMLGLMGFQSRAVHNVPDALAAIRKARPLCVLLDVNMPDLDGLDLAKQIRQECGDDVIMIAISGAGPEDARAAETFAIVDHHFAKPVDIEELERVLLG